MPFPNELRHLDQSLAELAELLGYERAAAVSWEGPERVVLDDQAYPAERAAGLDFGRLQALLQPIRMAVTCYFALQLSDLTEADPDQIILDVVRAAAKPEAVAIFQERIADCQTLILGFELDKARLLAAYEVAAPASRPILYIFPAALARFIAGQTPAGAPAPALACLQAFERYLWPKASQDKAVILAPGQELWLAGPRLALVGGVALENWQALAQPAEGPTADLAARYQRARDVVTWDDRWLAFLTPDHLALAEPEAGPFSEAAEALLADLLGHQLNLILLYTANRTSGQAQALTAAFWDSQKRADLSLRSPAELADQVELRPLFAAQAGQLLAAYQWVYDSEWPRDRLPFFQGLVAQELERRATANPYQALLEAAAGFLSGLKRRWDQFRLNKLKGYSADQRALNQYAVDVVAAYSAQIGELIKAVSETMLAAIAALLGSFIAAGFNQNTFDVQIFTIGMVVYALYVLLFPLAYNMSSQWMRYQALEDQVQASLTGFRDPLGPGPVAEIERLWIGPGRERFRLWFGLTIAVYLLAIAFGLAAAFLVPEII